MWYTNLINRNIIPDYLIRFQIRRLIKQRIKEETQPNKEAQHKRLMDLVLELKRSPIAINTSDANEQHYELPTEFFRFVLGPYLKYSCGLWSNTTSGIEASEEDMLYLSCERAELKDGMDILELGCGWGSLSLYMAQKFPNSNIIAVSNSSSQKKWIDSRTDELKISNLTIITSDMNDFSTDKTFDRVISIEMFEHMRNYNLLLEKISGFLRNEGKLFVHIFSHKEFAYKFEVRDDSDWMSKYFFTGGIMPSDNLFFYFNDNMKIVNHWKLNGTNYEKTANSWLNKMDENKTNIMPIMEDTYGKKDAVKWFVFWRIFFMACAELWGYNNGNDWLVSHYLFSKQLPN
ncbi:MAG: cyclopropane-fatty-acyl-phospholipid synthase [Bacteroidales bacterium]|jgi:cyclopropane-fatty-acyl-phospholipid synthase|nr:cyclopropane-fatty-acyl-phospholipid synthase [Bacteroidales bacterium]MDG2080606.1 cyclopropane-fatty-acyl-phospholipid synthase [Bacteroidales bacterium]